MIKPYPLPVQRISPEGHQHFFVYFHKFPTDDNDRNMLAHEADFIGRQPTPEDRVRLGVLRDGKFEPFAETATWCWQQGCMLQYLRDGSGRIIYNDRDGDQAVSRIYDPATGKTETKCRPVYCLSPDGRHAVSINFSRLDKFRAGYGYAGLFDPAESCDHSDEDGAFLVDLVENTSKLVVSLDRVTREFHRSGEYGMDRTPGWFNHLLFSPDGKRFGFFHRWRTWKNSVAWHLTHMFTVNCDGTELYPLNLEDMSSHYTWISNTEIINFSNRYADGWQYHLFTDRTGEVKTVAHDVFPGDGHCSYSPDNKWMLTDCYPGDQADRKRHLYLYSLETCEAFEIGAFHSEDWIEPVRCDLHPRWMRDGRRITFDSSHELSRQMYEIDLTPLMGK